MKNLKVLKKNTEGFKPFPKSIKGIVAKRAKNSVETELKHFGMKLLLGRQGYIFGFASEDHPSGTGRNHRQVIWFSETDINAKNFEKVGVKVQCNCEYYNYFLAYALNYHNTALPRKINDYALETEAPERNPKNIPHLCKHLYAAAAMLKDIDFGAYVDLEEDIEPEAPGFPSPKKKPIPKKKKVFVPLKELPKPKREYKRVIKKGKPPEKPKTKRRKRAYFPLKELPKPKRTIKRIIKRKKPVKKEERYFKLKNVPKTKRKYKSSDSKRRGRKRKYFPLKSGLAQMIAEAILSASGQRYWQHEKINSQQLQVKGFEKAFRSTSLRKF